MRAFRPVGRFYVAGLDPTEREVLATVVADVAELLGAERFGSDDGAADGAGSSAWASSGRRDRRRPG